MKPSLSGESLFLSKLIKRFKTSREDVIVGIGDDAAVLRQSDGQYLLVTTDSQVEGVHFKRKWMNPSQLGERAVAVALSDIAAMGGRPRHILVSLIIPGINKSHPEFISGSHKMLKQVQHDRMKNVDEHFIDRLYEGILNACRKQDVDIIGGNLSKGKQLIIDITVLGYVKSNEMLLRSGAKPGDAVLVTGTLGDAAAGLSLFKYEIRNMKYETKFLLSRFIHPVPRIREGQVIAKSGLATSMIDISDGLSTDLLHICDASGVGVRIYEEKLPVSNALKMYSSNEVRSSRYARTIKQHPNVFDLALHGGEDYELCFTIPQRYAEQIIAKIREKTGTEVTVIGKIIPKKEGRWVVDEKGRKKPLKAGGWDHFSRLSS